MASILDSVTWLPVLQLVHVTDLHVKHITANPDHALQGAGRVLARALKRRIERGDRWDDGTQGHYPLAPESFRRFLVNWKDHDPKWRDVPIWLVDTGDRTAFGDAASIAAGEGHLARWQQALGSCPVRTLFGNHDAWPGTLPGLLPGSLKAQRAYLAQQAGWDVGDWLANPLSVALPDGKARIELYALDSVCWTVARNTRAVGRIEPAALRAFLARLRIAAASGITGLRILAMHHPLAFPWTSDEVRAAGVFSAMKLLDDEDNARFLRNDANDPAGFGPLVHLVLSGHTHLSHPAARLGGDVVDIHQGLLAPHQLQLVGGSLMLNKSRRAARPAAAAPASPRAHDQFVPATVDSSNCQSQILRFMASADLPGVLWVARVPVLSVDGTLYEAGIPDWLVLHYDTP